MKKLRLLFTGTFLAVSLLSFGQKPDKEKVTYSYIQAPLINVGQDVKNYIPEVVQVNKDYILQQQQNQNNSYEQKVAAWEKECQMRRSVYEQEMEEYNKKNWGQKLAEKKYLGKSKPVLYLPPRPYQSANNQEYIEKLFDTEMLASSYQKIEGFTKSNNQGFKYEIRVFGFEYSVPEVKERRTSVKQNGTTKMVTMYYHEIRYKQPIGVRIISPEGVELLNQTVEGTDKMRRAETPAKQSQYAAQSAYTLNNKLLECQNYLIKRNMKMANDFANEQVGFLKKTKTVKLYDVKEKKYKYKEYKKAFKDQLFALRNLVVDEKKSKETLATCGTTWKKLLDKRNIKSKKAKVNKRLTEAICKNAWEAYILTNNFNGCQEVINILYELEPSKKDKKRIAELENTLADAKLRAKAQG